MVSACKQVLASRLLPAGLLGKRLSLAYSASAAKAGEPRFVLPDLPYAYDALEPVISSKIMQLHHQKHHATYVANLNKAVAEYERAKLDGNVSGMTACLQAIRFNGGGHVNHSIFWRNLCPTSKAIGRPDGPLVVAIEREFGSFNAFKELFMKQTAAIQGSGWGWLVPLLQQQLLSQPTSAIIIVGMESEHRTSPVCHNRKSGPAQGHHRLGSLARHRRLGACLLSAVRECASNLSPRHLVHPQLAGRRGTIHGGAAWRESRLMAVCLLLCTVCCCCY